MASRLFTRAAFRRTAIGTTSLGIAGFASFGSSSSDPINTKASAADMFAMSSQYSAPPGWKGRIFQIRNNYPTVEAQQLPTLPGPDMPPGYVVDEAPWLGIDFRKEPERYCEVIKSYCWEGNVNNEFVVQNNPIRNWYHAPWMHYNVNGREPLNGLTYERPTPAKELAETQDRILQNWACGYYNETGALTFGDMWANPANPKWDKHITFRPGTCVFKILMTDAEVKEVPLLEGSPTLEAVIAEQPQKGETGAGKRLNCAKKLRLIQVDFAVRDDSADIGWVFGTFMYDGTKKDKNPWNRIIPVGIMWGNDPDVNQEKVDQYRKDYPGEKNYPMKESWINPEAEKLRLKLKGGRPSWGWNGRMNGPADNFISACASCHSTAQQGGPKTDGMTQPVDKNTKLPDPANDSTNMRWFRNLPSGTAFSADKTPRALSADYSLQLQIGYYNYLQWIKDKTPRYQHGAKYVFSSAYRDELGEIEQKRSNGRAGPEHDYEGKSN